MRQLHEMSMMFFNEGEDDLYSLKRCLQKIISVCISCYQCYTGLINCIFTGAPSK